VEIVARRNLALDGRSFLSKSNRFLEALSAKGSCSGECVDGLEPVGFALTVVAEDYVEPWSPGYFAAEISEIIYFDKVQDHRQILAHDEAAKTPRRPRITRK
jgi:hypothetical protein